MNVRENIYLGYSSARGYRFPFWYREFAREYRLGTPDIVERSLKEMLRHAIQAVPYYARAAEKAGLSVSDLGCPETALTRLPILTKVDIRSQGKALHSFDLDQRKHFSNTSGGSTGEPVSLIQDTEYTDRTTAISILYQALIGRNIGEPMVRLWGSERDIEWGTGTWKTRFFNTLTNTSYLNAFRMRPAIMTEFIHSLNRNPPKLIMAYAQAIYELAQFAQREKLKVERQEAIITSAGTLYPFMRTLITEVFGAPVFNWYGSREVSAVGCELPNRDGLWVAPWGNYVEVVNEDGEPVPSGTEGRLLITCLTNFAMPLIRYEIGDRGALLPESGLGRNKTQVLQHVSGRNVDVFRTSDGTMVDGEYFTHLLYHRNWVWKFQAIQRSHSKVVFRIVKTNQDPDPKELEEIRYKTRLVMGEDCEVDVEFVPDLLPHSSGKYRYTISEVAAV